MNSPMNKEFAEIEKLQNIDKVVMDKNIKEFAEQKQCFLVRCIKSKRTIIVEIEKVPQRKNEYFEDLFHNKREKPTKYGKIYDIKIWA